MESKVNYAVVGLFVIVFGILGAVIVVWLVGSGRMESSYKNYIVYTNENISGLHVDSTVRYKGLDVGRVSKIEIDRKHPNFIKIYVEVDKNMPVNKNTVATISSSGLTGISYIDLSYSKSPPKLPFTLKEKYPVIPTVPTQFQEILGNLPKVLNSVNKVFDRINAIFDANTVKSIREMAGNLSILTKDLKRTNLEAQKLIKDADRLVISLNSNSKSMDKITLLVKKTLLDIDNLTMNLNQTNLYTKETVIKEGFETLKEAKRTLLELKQFIMEIKRNPSLIIRGRKGFNPTVGGER